MKRLLPVLAVILAFTCTLATDNVYAKKFGSSKSFGRSFQTAPSQSKLFSQKSYNQSGFQQKSFGNNIGNNQNYGYKTPQRQRGMFSGAMGGFLGGMLAGGLISSLFGGFGSTMGGMGGMGGGFSGLRFMDILLLAGLAFLLFKLFKAFIGSKAGGMRGGPKQKGYYQSDSPWQNDADRSNQHNGFRNTAFRDSNLQDGNAQDRNFRDSISGFRASDQSDAQFPEQEHGHQGGFGSGMADNDIPLNLPNGFDLNGFLNRARNHYRTIQEAWNKGDMNTLRDYVSPDLFQHLQNERATLTGDQHTEVMYVDAELVRAEHDYGRTELSLRFRGRYRDNVERVEEKITDIWHLEQNGPNAPWVIVGIEYGDD